VEITYDATEPLKLSAAVSIEALREIGLDYRKTERAVFAEARWAVHESLDLIVEGSAKRETRRGEDVGTTDRALIRAGLASSF